MPRDEVNILNTFRVMIILRLLLLLTNLHPKLLSTQGTGADKLLSTQRVNMDILGKIAVTTVYLNIMTCSFHQNKGKIDPLAMDIKKYSIFIKNLA